jgi:crotonobetainyl-CoA:carnitine CoA-transferase CaiB-like acyl-CoA transferase
MRVLDLTRVIAGPVAGRTLGSFGADVLRLDNPDRLELPFHQIDGILGKRSALLDITTAPGAKRLHELLQSADVVMYGYRPGSSALEPQLLAERYPGIVVVQLSAWGENGPWGGRRGFDSLVQAASGIAHLQYTDDDRPGTLPCQLLDHATGYLMAASALLGVRERSRNGGSHLLQLSLAGTAKKLLESPRATLHEEAKSTATIEDWTAAVVRSDGTTISAVTPPGTYDGVPLRWPVPMGVYGQAIPAWDPSTTTF